MAASSGVSGRISGHASSINMSPTRPVSTSPPMNTAGGNA